MQGVRGSNPLTSTKQTPYFRDPRLFGVRAEAILQRYSKVEATDEHRTRTAMTLSRRESSNHPRVQGLAIVLTTCIFSLACFSVDASASIDSRSPRILTTLKVATVPRAKSMKFPATMCALLPLS